MKKTFLAKRNALLAFMSYSWGARALLVVLLLLLVRLSAPTFFWRAATPLFRFSDALTGTSHVFFASFSDAAALSAQNELLLQENANLQSENVALRQQLQNLAGVDTTRTTGIFAAVIVRPPASPYDVVLVARGEMAGVAVGMEAFTPAGVPLGIVEVVEAEVSWVRLFSSAGMKTNGWVGQASAPLTLLGAGGGAFTATLARAAEVSVGDTVFVPGPGQLPLGVVARVDDDPTSPSVVLRIRPLANLFSLGVVELRATGLARVATSTSP